MNIQTDLIGTRVRPHGSKNIYIIRALVIKNGELVAILQPCPKFGQETSEPVVSRNVENLIIC